MTSMYYREGRVIDVPNAAPTATTSEAVAWYALDLDVAFWWRDLVEGRFANTWEQQYARTMGLYPTTPTGKLVQVAKLEQRITRDRGMLASFKAGLTVADMERMRVAAAEAAKKNSGFAGMIRYLGSHPLAALFLFAPAALAFGAATPITAAAIGNTTYAAANAGSVAAQTIVSAGSVTLSAVPTLAAPIVSGAASAAVRPPPGVATSPPVTVPPAAIAPATAGLVNAAGPLAGAAGAIGTALVGGVVAGAAQAVQDAKIENANRMILYIGAGLILLVWLSS